MSEKIFVIPPKRTRYLSEISDNNRAYDKWSSDQKEVAQELYGIHKSMETIQKSSLEDKDRLLKGLQEVYAQKLVDLDPKNKQLIDAWSDLQSAYKASEYKFKVRDKELAIKTHTKSLSHSDIPKICLPKYEGGEMCYTGNYKRMCQVDFHIQLVCFRLKEKGKILLECLLEKVDQKEQTSDFIMSV